MDRYAEYIYSTIKNQASINQIVVQYNDKCCKVKRDNYFPNKGIITLEPLLDWSEIGYSVGELIEVSERYKESIEHIQFKAYNGKEYPLINVFESNAIGLEDEYVCLVIIGDEIGVMSEIHGIGNHNTVINKLQTDNMF